MAQHCGANLHFCVAWHSIQAPTAIRDPRAPSDNTAPQVEDMFHVQRHRGRPFPDGPGLLYSARLWQ